MNILIIEDEKHASDKLKKMLGVLDPGIRVVDVLESVQQSVEWLMARQAPDLIFMDIQLDDGICFEIFEAVKIQTPVIFTTAFDEYALRAFKVNSIDYLLKPVDKGNLAAALEKFKTLYAGKSASIPEIERLISQLGGSYKTRFFIKAGEHCKSVPVSEVKCFYIVGKATLMKTASGFHYGLEYSLENLQKILDPVKFFRINRGHIINIDFIHDIISYSASRLLVVLKDEKEIPNLIVSREKVPEFRQWLDR
ncbi:MAG TPA: LytTR family DNA-binding domain-containing protein [Cyclobacteriaceae bacterium]|nr:LytTR family DNA-binding domain-containing protein [Cyclobacteriaceae bacterium]